MRVVFGTAGFVESAAGDRFRAERPHWQLVEATGPGWRDALAGADVAVPVTASVGADELAGGLRLVQQFGVGLDSVDLDACRAAGVPVANVPSTETANAVSVAEIAMALVLDLARGIDRERRGVASGGTRGAAPHTLAGRRVLLVGLGGLGAAIAVRLAAFGVTVVATRAHPEQGGAPGVSEVHGAGRLDELLGTVDGAVLCATPSGDGPLFDAGRFARMRTGSFFVNVSRGIAVDEPALLAALDSGRVAGAGLDVVVHEPARPDDPLVVHPRVVVTPHLGGSTVENLVTTADAVIGNVDRLERGEPLRWLAG